MSLSPKNNDVPSPKNTGNEKKKDSAASAAKSLDDFVTKFNNELDVVDDAKDRRIKEYAKRYAISLTMSITWMGSWLGLLYLARPSTMKAIKSVGVGVAGALGFSAICKLAEYFDKKENENE